MNNYTSLIAQFALHLAHVGKQPATVESYCRDAESFCAYLQRFSITFHELQPSTLHHYREYLQWERQEKPNSVRRSIIGVRQFFRFLMNEQHIPSTPFDEVPLPPRQEDLPTLLQNEDVDLLLSYALEKNPSPKGERDAAVCALLAFEGLKASELTQLKWSDFMSDGDYASLRIPTLGPQRSTRVVALQKATAVHLNRYAEALKSWDHPFVSSAKNQNMMFIGFKGRHHLTPLPYLSRHGLKFMLYELGAKLAIPKLNTEHLRHFAINFLLSQGSSAEQIMLHLGLRRLGNIAKYQAKLSSGVIS